MEKDILDAQNEVVREIDETQKTMRHAADGNLRIRSAVEDLKSATKIYNETLDALRETVRELID